MKLLSFRLINNYWSNYYIYTYIYRRLAQLGVNRNRLQRRREGMKRAAGDFRRACEGKKSGDQQAVVEHISPSFSLSLSLSLSLYLFFALIRMNCSKRRRRQPKFAAMSLLLGTKVNSMASRVKGLVVCL